MSASTATGAAHRQGRRVIPAGILQGPLPYKMVLQLAEYIGPRTVAPGKANTAPRGFSLQARGRPRDKLHRPRNSPGKPRGYNMNPGGIPRERDSKGYAGLYLNGQRE